MPAELGALLLADGRLPTGGHAHSGGLEPALAAGTGPDDVPRYLAARLRTVGLVEAAAAVLTVRRCRTAGADVDEVQVALRARMPSAPARTASELLGRGLARLARRLWPGHTAVAALDSLGAPPLRPVALGVVGAAVGMSDAQVARASLYDDAQTVTAAALKLLPVDPTDATRWLLDAGPTLEEIVARALTCTGPDTMPATTAPLVEQYSLDHESRSRRIFVA